MIEYIITYISLISNLVSSLISYKILTKDKININFKNSITMLFLTYVSLIIRYYNNGMLTLLSNSLFIYIILRLFYKISNSKAIYYDVFITIICLFSDVLISFIISTSYLLNVELLQSNYLLRAMLNIPLLFIIILISVLPFVKKSIGNLYEKYISKIKFNKLTFLFFSAIFSIIIIAFCLNYYNEVNKVGHAIVILGIISFTLLFFCILYSMYSEFQINQCNKQIIEENNYIKYIAKQDEEFKHNLVNNLLGIKTVSNKKTGNLIDELINEYQQEYKNITNINDLPNGIQSIIYRKAYEEELEDLNLLVNNEINEDLYYLLTPKKYNNLCTSIGILFDNALEAVKNSKEKVIEINFSQDKENIYLILKNSFSNFIDLEEIGKRNITTKIKGHGIGVNYVKKLKTLELKNEIINNMFISKIIIKKSKKI